jgi:hypothetical protein
MERDIDMMEETLQSCERAQRSTQDASHRRTFPFGLRPSSDVYQRQAAKSIQIQSGRQEPISDLKVKPRARRDPLDVPCVYHKGARHTLRGCRLQKKIDQELDVARATQTPTSPDDGEFQKARIRISPNSQRSTPRRVLVVSANDPPRVGATDSEEARRIQANAKRAHRRAEEQRQAVPPCARDLRIEFEEAGLPTFNSPQANLGAALARLQQADPSPEVEAAMEHVGVATALVEEKSVASKSAASTSSRHSRSRLIGLRIAGSPRSRRRPTSLERELRQPPIYVPTSTRTGAVAMPAVTSTNATASVRSERCDIATTTITHGPPGGVHRIMEREERERHDAENRRRAQYEKDYGHPEGPVRNRAQHPRSDVVAAAQDDDAAQVGDSGDDMALAAFPVLAPHLRSVAYPDNFKPNIQKYDSRSNPNIWLSTYYVAVKAAGGNFDHIVTPQELINVINANDRINRVKPAKHRSNLGQPGSSPRKPHQ